MKTTIVSVKIPIEKGDCIALTLPGRKRYANMRVMSCKELTDGTLELELEEIPNPPGWLQKQIGGKK